MSVTFGYTCQECGEGTVRATTIPEYETLVHGVPFTVKDAVIGVCDNCEARNYDMAEVERWEREFET